MRATNKELPVAAETPAFTSRQAVWGACTVDFTTVTGGTDFTEPFSEMPGGACQTAHWGYVIKGRIRIKYADHEEILGAGDAYHLIPGHVPVVEEDSELIEFSLVNND
jgi:hypothetical protein